MNQLRQAIATITLTLLGLCSFVSCDSDTTLIYQHPTYTPTEGAYSFTLNSGGAVAGDTHVLLFNSSNALAAHFIYTSAEHYTRDLTLSAGSYDVVAVTNLSVKVQDHITLLGITLPELLTCLSDDATLSTMPIALTTVDVSTSSAEATTALVFDCVSSVRAIDYPRTSLLLSLPDAVAPEYGSTTTKSKSLAAIDGYDLRSTIEVRSSRQTLFKRSYILTEQDAELNYMKSIYLGEGEYDVLVWSDYVLSSAVSTDDLHYDTSDLSNIWTLSKDLYRANCDSRSAYAGYNSSIHVTKGGDNSALVSMSRPVAKYTLVATDVEKYNSSRDTTGNPSLEDLTIEVSYTGYYPTAYSVSSGRLTGAMTGYGYVSCISSLDDSGATSTATVAKDYVFVASGAESSVTLAIIVKGPDGAVVSEFNNLKVSYRSGYHSTLSGSFLTSGSGDGGDGGFELEQEWDGSYNVEF